MNVVDKSTSRTKPTSAKVGGAVLKAYIANIQGTKGGTKLPHIKARTFGSDIVILNETNRKADDEGAFKTLGLKFGRISNTPNPDRTGHGYGTFVGSKELVADSGDRLSTHDHFEIGVVCRHINSLEISVIGMYRSLSMDAAECCEFYRELRKMIEDCSSSDVIVIAGDDNSHDHQNSYAKARNAFRELEAVRRQFNGVHIVNECTRGSNQTDHVVAIFDPLLYDVSAVVCPGVGDHCEMHVTVTSKRMVLEEPKWQQRTVTVSEGDPVIIDMMLREKLSMFTYGLVDLYGLINQDVVDQLVSTWMAIVKEVREGERKTVRRTFPTGPGRLGSASQREMQFCKNKLSVLYSKLGKVGADVGALRSEIQSWKVKYETAAKASGKERLEKDMSNMRKFQKVDTRRFFESTGFHLKSDQMDVALSEAEIDAKLVKAEQNYYQKGPLLSREQFEDIVPDAQFEIPYDVKTLEEEFKKLKKVDTFYKEYRDALIPSLSAIAYALHKSHMFPSECKIMKLCFLKSRTIFSADFLTKIFEALAIRGLDAVLPEETLGQMAYQKGRSTVLCVAYGLNEAEKLDDLGICYSADQVKAFDSARWATICQVMQKEAGAGEFHYQYFSGRNYRFKGELGFKDQPQARGTMPGSKLGPKQFGKFQSSDRGSTLENPIWLWPGTFSDDKVQLTAWFNLLNGKFQEALTSTWNWSQENFVAYHLSGKKAPEYNIFRKNGCNTSTALPHELLLGETPVKRGYELTQLGVFVRFFRDEEVANNYGYWLDWKSTKTQFPRIAERLKQIKDSWDPPMRRRTVTTYLEGKLSYAACLYWLRAKQANIDEMRYYHTMGLASVMGMEIPELVSLQGCKDKRVRAQNKGYLAACEFLNMPTLKDMAIKSARVLIKQWAHYNRAQFVYDNDTIVGICDEDKDSLLGDIYKLARCKPTDFYPVFNAVKGPQKRATTFHPEELPLWQRYWYGYGAEARKAGVRSVATDNMGFNTMCRDHFKVLEPVTRVKKHLDRAVSEATTRTSGDIEDDEEHSSTQTSHRNKRLRGDNGEPEGSGKGSKKRKRGGELQAATAPILTRLTCAVPMPKGRGRPCRRPCRICGFVIGETSKRDIKKGVITHPCVKFVCCDREAHSQCWRSAKVSDNDEVKCSNLTALTRKCRKVLIPTSMADPDERVIKSYAVCEYCGEKIDKTGDSNHIRDHCKVLQDLRTDMTVVNDLPGSKMNEIRRKARTALVLACAKLKVPLDLRDAAERHAGSGRAQTSPRSASADSQVL